MIHANFFLQEQYYEFQSYLDADFSPYDYMDASQPNLSRKLNKNPDLCFTRFHEKSRSRSMSNMTVGQRTLRSPCHPCRHPCRHPLQEPPCHPWEVLPQQLLLLSSKMTHCRKRKQTRIRWTKSKAECNWHEIARKVSDNHLAASTKAVLITFRGSMIPDLTISTYSPVLSNKKIRITRISRRDM